MAFVHKLFCVGLGVTVLTSLVGCGTKRFNVTVSLQESLRDSHGVMPAVDVDIVAVNDTELPTWQQKSMTELFTRQDPLLASAAKFPMVLGEDMKSGTLSISDNLWSVWHDRGATNLLILCSYPTSQQDLPSDQDPRRRTLPLDGSRWEWGTDTLKVVVDRTGLTVLTPPKPAK